MAKIVVKRLRRSRQWYWSMQEESGEAFNNCESIDDWTRKATAIRHAEAFRDELGATEETLPIEVEE